MPDALTRLARLRRRPRMPAVWVGYRCTLRGCTARGHLHTHRRAEDPFREDALLARLASLTAASDPWTAASVLFGPPLAWRPFRREELR